MFLLSSIIYHFSPVSVAEASSVASATYETTANLRLRAGASINNKVILTIPKGKTVIVIERKGDWYKVSYNRVIGWVSGSYVKQKVTNVKTTSAIVMSTAAKRKITYETTANVQLRTGAGINYKPLTTIPKGKIVISSESKGNWHKVSYEYVINGKKRAVTGWLHSAYVREFHKYVQTSGVYYLTKKITNVYSTPDVRKVGGQLPQNIVVYSKRTVINSIGQTLYEIQWKGKKGYVLSTDVVSVQPKKFVATKYVAGKNTFLYASFGSVYGTLGIIPQGEVVITDVSIGNWYKVVYKDKTGYIFINDFAPYVESTEQHTPPSQVSDEQQNRNEMDKQENEPNKQTENDATVPPTFIEKEITGRVFLIVRSSVIRKQPDASATAVGTMAQGTFIVPTHETSNKWYKVSSQGVAGYVQSEDITEVKTGVPLDGNRNSYQFIDLRTPSSVTAQQINSYIQNYVNATKKQSVLLGKGQVFIDAGNKYGVNPLFLAAHAIHESAFGTSKLALTKYNLFGFGAYDATPFVGAYRFASVDQCIYYIAQQLKATYLNPKDYRFQGAYLGFRTNALSGTRINASSEGMNFYYASDPYWGVKIAKHMANMLAYNSNDYRSAKVNASVPSLPAIPALSDVFPNHIVAVANADLDLYINRGDREKTLTLPKGDTFLLLEKTNDFWVRIAYNEQEYWTNSIKFYEYSKYISVKNLASVTAYSLNVRSTPSTEHSPIATLSLGEYIELALDDKGELQVQNNWYKVILTDGTEGWVSGLYITRELK
ncbi:MAG: SH3 domain-containing protein [Anoxybacillus sp.]|nr:SH3 domain-containing protein [Anoxybacillus sp.]